VREIALEIVRADGSRLPILVNSTLVKGPGGEPKLIRTTVFDASDRRRYEEELLRAQRQEREIAEQLQRSMLAGELPVSAEVEVAASYRPADSTLEVGGDWYDAFWLSRHRIGLVVGDVVGRGIEAAATMGQLRSATRALASTGQPPPRLLEALDAYAVRHRVGFLTTVVYMELDLDSHELRFSCAGHLPPVLAPAGEDAHLAWKGRSLPLGLGGRDEDARPEARCRLGPGSLVLLYTDGLVERRRRSLDAGLEQLVAEVEANRGEPAQRLTSNLLHAFATSERQDDACAMALSLRG
jgi:serine/threonine-protein kinase RsbW